MKLREKLQSEFPYICLPPLMNKSINFKEVASDRKAVYINFFFEFLLKIPEVCSSQSLVKFLSENAIDEKLPVPDSKAICTMSGKANCSLMVGNSVFHSNIANNIGGMRTAYQKINSLFNDLASKCTDIDTIAKELSTNFSSLSEKGKKLLLNDYIDINNRLSECFTSVSKKYSGLSNVYRNAWGTAMQIMDKGLESLQEVSKKCLDTQNTFVKCKQALQLKKEKLFVTKNFQAWELPDDKKDLINNKLEAVKLMLPKVIV